MTGVLDKQTCLGIAAVGLLLLDWARNAAMSRGWQCRNVAHSIVTFAKMLDLVLMHCLSSSRDYNPFVYPLEHSELFVHAVCLVCIRKCGHEIHVQHWKFSCEAGCDNPSAVRDMVAEMMRCVHIASQAAV